MNSSRVLFINLSCLILLVIHSPLPASCENLIETVCNDAMQDKERCLEVLKADPRIASAKNYVEFSKLVLEMAVKKGTQAQNQLKQVAKTNPTPAIQECATTDYDELVGSFKSALGEIKEDSMTANYDAKVAGDGPDTCDRALAEENVNNPSISALNKEVKLLSTIAFLATNKLPPSPDEE